MITEMAFNTKNGIPENIAGTTIDRQGLALSNSQVLSVSNPNTSFAITSEDWKKASG
jgi:hypothetical protein